MKREDNLNSQFEGAVEGSLPLGLKQQSGDKWVKNAEMSRRVDWQEDEWQVCGLEEPNRDEEETGRC